VSRVIEGGNACRHVTVYVLVKTASRAFTCQNIYIIFAPSFIHFSLATSERFAFPSCNQGPVTSQAETPKTWLYWDQKIENHDDWIMNYHGVQLQPRLLEALIGCLQFFPEHIRAHEMSLIMDLPAQPSSQVHNPGARDAFNLVISCRRSRNVASIRFPLLIKITTPSQIELSSASTPQRIRIMLVRDPYSTKAD
jgi:hypothetical protein